MSITSTGLASGLDIESLVSQLVAADIATPANRYDRKEAKYQLEISSLGVLKSELSAFKDSLLEVSQVNNFQKKLASSSLDSKVAVTANQDAIAGNYSIAVTNLAVAQSLAQSGDGFAKTTDSVGEGTLSINDGTNTVNITIDSGNNSLQGLANAINAADVNANATIVNDGSGYKLVLSATKTGTANTLSITATADADNNLTDSSSLSQFISANLTQTIAAENATLTINGLAVTSASNSVVDAVEGITFDLKSETDVNELASVNISDDKGKLISSINSFVEGYNKLLGTISTLTSYDAASKTSSPLTGDASVRAIAAGIRNVLNSRVENVSGSFSSITEIGITSSSLSGELSIDSKVLDAAIVKNPLDVANVFASIARSSSDSVTFESSKESTQVGDYAVNFVPPTGGSVTSAVLTVSGSALDFSGGNADVQFLVSVDGVTSNTISLNGNYTTGGSNAANLQLAAAALQTKINEALPNNTVVVSAETSTNKLKVTSANPGSGSTVVFSNVARLDSIGLNSGTTSETGVAGSGTIHGEAAAYDATAKTLTAAVNSVADGLVLRLKGNPDGDLGKVKYSIGLSQDMNSLIDNFLGSQGLIDTRIGGLTESVSAINKQRSALESRAVALESLYRNQFNGLETLLSQLNTTQSFLDSALSRFVEPLDFKK